MGRFVPARSQGYRTEAAGSSLGTIVPDERRSGEGNPPCRAVGKSRLLPGSGRRTAGRPGARPAAQWMRNDENVSLQALPTHGVSLVNVHLLPPKLPSV